MSFWKYYPPRENFHPMTGEEELCHNRPSHLMHNVYPISRCHLWCFPTSSSQRLKVSYITRIIITMNTSGTFGIIKEKCQLLQPNDFFFCILSSLILKLQLMLALVKLDKECCIHKHDLQRQRKWKILLLHKHDRESTQFVMLSLFKEMWPFGHGYIDIEYCVTPL